MVRILEMVARGPPYRSGTTNVAVENAKQLSKHGFDVTLVSLDHASWAGSEQVTRRPLRLQNAGWFRGLSNLQAPDLVHLHLPFIGGGTQALRLRERLRIPLVVTYHQDLTAKGARGVLFAFYNKWGTAPILRRSNRIIVPTVDYAKSSQLAEDLMTNRLVEIPHGVDSQRFRPRPAPSDLFPRIGGAAATALFVGGLDRAHSFKGLPVLLKALTLTKNVIGLVVVGTGELAESYRGLAVKLKVADRVHFAGSVSTETLPDYYNATDVTVLPSTGPGEIFGLVLLEAMASEKPVIASNLPGVRSVVDDGINGRLVQASSAQALALALDEIVEEPAVRSWGSAGRIKAVRSYDWDRIGTQLAIVMQATVEEA